MPNGYNLSLDPSVPHIQLQRLRDARLMNNAQQMAANLSTTKLDPKQNQAMDKASEDFEAVFLSQVIKPMFESVDVDSTFGGGKGEEMFRGMLSDEYGKIMAKAGGIGLASPVKEALLQAQEHGHVATALQ